MVITLIVFTIFFILTLIDQICLSIACRHARNAGLKISKSDEFLNVLELKTWSKISDFANREPSGKLKRLITVHEYLFNARIVTFLLFIVAGLYSTTEW